MATEHLKGGHAGEEFHIRLHVADLRLRAAGAGAAPLGSGHCSPNAGRREAVASSPEGAHLQPSCPVLRPWEPEPAGPGEESRGQAEGWLLSPAQEQHILSLNLRKQPPLEANPAGRCFLLAAASLPRPAARLQGSHGGGRPSRGHSPCRGRGASIQVPSTGCFCHCLCKQVNCFLPQLKTSAT